MYEPNNKWEDVQEFQTRDEWLEDCIISATGFCGCGNPDDAYRTLRDVLTILKVRSLKWDRGKDIDHRMTGFHTGLEKVVGFRSLPGVAYGYFYWIDHMNLTEHGGAVPGWLTSKGEMVLGWLNEMLGLENKTNG